MHDSPQRHYLARHVSYGNKVGLELVAAVVVNRTDFWTRRTLSLASGWRVYQTRWGWVLWVAMTISGCVMSGSDVRGYGTIVCRLQKVPVPCLGLLRATSGTPPYLPPSTVHMTISAPSKGQSAATPLWMYPQFPWHLYIITIIYCVIRINIIHWSKHHSFTLILNHIIHT